LAVDIVKSKGKVDHVPQESIGRCSSPSSRHWAHRQRTTNVCDAWPVWRQTYGYLPSRKALAGTKLYCLMTETRVLTCPGLHSTAGQLGFEPATVS